VGRGVHSPKPPTGAKPKYILKKFKESRKFKKIF
jgi:hypothetical protein